MRFSHGFIMVVRSLIASLSLLSLLFLVGCGSAKENTTQPNYMGMYGPGGSADPGSILGDQGLVFGTSKKRADATGGGGGLGVNAYLWRGTLDTLSFMPLASADPFGGVIITDWYTPPASNGERFKATAYILGRELRSDGIRIKIG